VVIAFVDILVLAELFVSIYVANRHPEEFTLVFFKYFFGMLIPTLLLARFLVRRYRSEEHPSET
jgi:hypothetical protein